MVIGRDFSNFSSDQLHNIEINDWLKGTWITCDSHTEKSILNLVNSKQFWIVITSFRLINRNSVIAPDPEASVLGSISLCALCRYILMVMNKHLLLWSNLVAWITENSLLHREYVDSWKNLIVTENIVANMFLGLEHWSYTHVTRFLVSFLVTISFWLWIKWSYI